jgi:hypothetical protein
VTFVDTHGLSNRPCSYTSLSLPELESGDEVFFQATYGETADIVQGLLEKIYILMRVRTPCYLSMVSDSEQLRRVVL